MIAGAIGGTTVALAGDDRDGRDTDTVYVDDNDSYVDDNDSYDDDSYDERRSTAKRR